MAKAATKKSLKTSKVSKPKKAPAAKSVRATLKKTVTAAKPPVQKIAAKASVPAKKTRAVRAPVITKDELRNQIERLTAVNATLKTKNRETAKALKAAEARIEVLEHRISQTEGKVMIDAKPTKTVESPRKMRAPKSEPDSAPEADILVGVSAPNEEATD